jgi:alpha-mannosidase
MADGNQLLVVPHTHWDREWYQTFQQFRIRLVSTVDTVLDVLESDSAFTDFMLDGQTIPLEDYLEVRPENLERLQRLTRSHRLLVGPWYLQPDEFLVGGESLIRNLQLGMRIAADFGGPMMIGYVPDIFGHIAQLPQLLRGFGIDNAVYWRGVGPEVERSEFRWAAPDGTSVLVVWLCDELGYSNARTLPLQTDALLARLASIESGLKARATTRTLLLMNGSDHLEPQAGLPEALAAANKRLRSEGSQLVIGTLPQYVEVIKRADPPLATYTGEMRSSRYAHLLPGVLSTRMWIKQRNAACEAELVRWAEPAAAWAWLLTGQHPSGLLRVSWRQLLYNHPHDSICGSGIDQVHEEMRSRFDQSEQVSREIAGAALDTLAAQVDTSAATEEGALPVVVFNPGPGPRTGVVSCDMEVEHDEVCVVDERGAPAPAEVRHLWQRELVSQEVAKGLVTSMLSMAQQGRVDKYVIKDVRFRLEPGSTVEEVLVTVAEQGEPNMAIVEGAVEHILASSRRDAITAFRFIGREVPRADVVFVAADVPAFGGKTYYLRPRRPDDPIPAERAALVTGTHSIENEWLLVEIHPASGTLTLVDKATGTRFSGLNLFEDGGDVGDLYNYSPPRADVLVANPRHRPRVELVSSGPARATLRVSMVYELPRACSEDRQARHFEMVECPIVTEVSLAPGARRVDIRTEVENQARDHRLRVIFPTPFAVDTHEAEDTFAVIRRPNRQPKPGRGEAPWEAWAEMPVNTHPQKRFVDVSDGKVGLAVLNRGLPEYELMPWPVSGGVAVALTLLRGVEWLSRADLDTRRGHAGPMEYTPLAQCLGKSVFEYALVPHAGTWHADEVLPLTEAQAFEATMRARVADVHPGKLSPIWSFLTVAPGSLVVSAVKRAEAENALVVRIYNPAEQAVTGVARLLFTFAGVRLANLNEEELPQGEAQAHELALLEDNGVRVHVRGGEIITLLFRF